MSTSKATMHAARADRAGQWRYCRALMACVVLGAACVLLVLACVVHGQQTIGFDAPLLWRLHQFSTPAVDDVFLAISRGGYQYGVIPLDIAIVSLLLLLRRWQQAWFAGAAMIGSAVLNLGIKQLLQRARPQLWESIAPEHTFSFPSAHAMGSMTLTLVVLALLWQTRWRWPVLLGAGAFALLVGLSRVYLGVHYPSDVVAAWCAAIVWVGTLYLLMSRRPQRA